MRGPDDPFRGTGLEIYEEIRKDREAGARRLVAEYRNRIYSAAFVLCGDEHEAEDLTFRTFAQVVRQIGKYRPSGSFFNWVYTILVNFRRMDVRRAKSRVALAFPETMPECADSRPNPAVDFLRRVDAIRVRAAVRRLPEILREVVLLRYFEDLSSPDIAAILGIPEGTVRSRLHYAKDLLFAELTRRDS